MKNSTTIALIAAAAMLVGAVQASAATLNGVTGQIFVNSGNGFKSVKNGATVNPGDVVMARNGGTAQIVYADGSSMIVEPGKSVSVGTSAGGVHSGITHTQLMVGAGVVAAGVGAAVIISNNNSKPSSP